jgi:hypothetical protein
VHWLVYPPLAAVSPALAVVGSLTAGIAYWMVCARIPTLLRSAKERTWTAWTAAMK